MQIRIEIPEAQARLAEPIESVERGGEILITQGGLPVARLVPAQDAGPDRISGSARNLFVVPDDFDAPLDEFRDYV